MSFKQPTFRYQLTKNEKVFIYYENKMVTTLKGKQALKFLKKVEGKPMKAQQLAMAKATGNFKRGNERQ